MSAFKIVNAWGIDNKKQDGGMILPGMNMSPYLLLALGGKVFNFEDTDFKDNLKKMIKWNYQYQMYKLVFQDMNTSRQYMAKINHNTRGRPMSVWQHNWS